MATYSIKELTQKAENGVWFMELVFHSLNCTRLAGCQSIMNVTTMSDKLQVCPYADTIEWLSAFAT